MSCTGDFLPKVKLRRNDADGDIIAQPAVHSQALALSGGRTRDDDHTIEVLLSRRFIQQRDVDAKPVFPRTRNFEQNGPSLVNARVQDRFEIFALVLVPENAFPQGNSVWSPIAMKCIRAKSGANEFPNDSISRE